MIPLRKLQVVVVACASCSLVLGQPSGNTASEQTHFSAEDDSVQTPIVIPPAIRKLLAADESVKDLAHSEKIRPEGFPDSWFSASAVHLSSKPLEDVLLVGRGPMHGANITQFWVFCATPDGHRLVLQTGAHDLYVTRRFSNHYREIDLLSATGIAVHNVSLRYDGDAYKPFRDFWQSTQ
jgi:hypothetical protein